MLLALHYCMVTTDDTVPDDGAYPLRILHQKWPHMMIEVMDMFMGVRAVINIQGRSSVIGFEIYAAVEGEERGHVDMV